VDLAVADRHLAAGRVDQQLADPDRAVVAAVAAAQDGGDPRPQLLVEEGLLDVVVGAEVEAADPVGGAAAAGQDDDRQVRVEARVDPVDLADLA
jgi:hypothetical protein